VQRPVPVRHHADAHELTLVVRRGISRGSRLESPWTTWTGWALRTQAEPCATPWGAQPGPAMGLGGMESAAHGERRRMTSIPGRRSKAQISSTGTPSRNEGAVEPWAAVERPPTPAAAAKPPRKEWGPPPCFQGNGLSQMSRNWTFIGGPTWIWSASTPDLAALEGWSSTTSAVSLPLMKCIRWLPSAMTR